jgi:hypothetical protein
LAIIYLTHPSGGVDGSDESDEKQPDPELDELVRVIFDIIPSYYDKDEAAAIAALIRDYVERKSKQGQ